MNIRVRVQHAAGRDACLERLLPGLFPLAVDVVTDTEVADPNPLRGYLRCLADPPADVTHLCVIQDDATVCDGFADKLHEAVEEKPDDLVALFAAGLPGQTKKEFLRALKRRERWAPVYARQTIHVVGMVWPVKTARAFLDWFPPVNPIPGTREPYLSDDMVVGYWVRVTKQQIWATVPCLVEHPDDVPSVAQTHRGGDGKDRGRRAIAFHGNIS